MTLVKIKSTGEYEGDFRVKGLPRLHIRLRTKNRKIAEQRHDHIHKLYRQKRVEMIDQLKSGVLTVERLESMVEHHEPLTPVATVEGKHSWGTVDHCAERYVRWITDHPNRREATAVSAAQQLRRFREFVVEGATIGERDLDAVTSEMIMAYQRHLIALGRSVNSITKTMTRVGALWRFVRKQEERDAQKKRRAPRPVYSPVDSEMVIRDHKRRERYLTEPEITALCEATPPSARFGVYCGVMAGLRVDEMLHLRKDLDVDLAMGALTIRDQDVWKPKTKRSRRTIPMAALLLEAAKWHAERNTLHGWMMPSRQVDHRPLTKGGWQRTFQSIVTRAGLVYGNKSPQGVTYHTLRHTFASQAAMRGVDLYTIAQLLGDSLLMVEQTYAHLSPDHKRAAIQKLESAFKMPQPMPQETDE